jgi:hypothetical protein
VAEGDASAEAEADGEGDPAPIGGAVAELAGHPVRRQATSTKDLRPGDWAVDMGESYRPERRRDCGARTLVLGYLDEAWLPTQCPRFPADQRELDDEVLIGAVESSAIDASRARNLGTGEEHLLPIG